MAKGENIFKRRDGRWEARYIKGRELSGKIRYGFCYGRTYKEAKEKVTQRKAAVLNGSPAPETGSRHRLAFYCDRWLELRRPKVKEATYIKYSTALEKHIKPRLGGCFPLGITGGLTDAFARELLEAGLSPKTVRDILAVLHGVLKYTAAQFPGIFPAVEIPYPKCGRKEMRVLSREEQQRLADYLLADLDPCRFGVLLAMHTGIRIGELCALRWSSISLKDRTLRISATLQRLRDTQEGGTRIVTGSPKSETSLRVIPLTDSAAALCGRMQPRNPAAYVLTGTEAWMEPRALQYRLEKYVRACGLEGVHFHTLRHSCASLLLANGVPLKQIQEWLGHSDFSTTANIYAHLDYRSKISSAQAMEQGMLLPRSDDFGSRWENVTEQGKITEPDSNPVFD